MNNLLYILLRLDQAKTEILATDHGDHMDHSCNSHYDLIAEMNRWIGAGEVVATLVLNFHSSTFSQFKNKEYFHVSFVSQKLYATEYLFLLCISDDVNDEHFEL